MQAIIQTTIRGGHGFLVFIAGGSNAQVIALPIGADKTFQMSKLYVIA
jgi:hypothetical protein